MFFSAIQKRDEYSVIYDLDLNQLQNITTIVGIFLSHVHAISHFCLLVPDFFRSRISHDRCCWGL